MEEYVVNQAGLGFLGWLILFLIIGAIPMLFKKNKEKNDEDPK